MSERDFERDNEAGVLRSVRDAPADTRVDSLLSYDTPTHRRA